MFWPSMATSLSAGLILAMKGGRGETGKSWERRGKGEETGTSLTRRVGASEKLSSQALRSLGPAKCGERSFRLGRKDFGGDV
jgi:hypothetical protein